MLKLSAQFHACCPCTNHCNVQWCVAVRSMCIQVMIEQCLMQLFGLAATVQERAVLVNARSTEVIALAANGHHQRVISNRTLGLISLPLASSIRSRVIILF